MGNIENEYTGMGNVGNGYTVMGNAGNEYTVNCNGTIKRKVYTKADTVD